MKKVFVTLAALVCFVSGIAARTTGAQLPQEAVGKLENCIVLMDNGMADAAMDALDALAEEYPDNYVVHYERVYALYMLGRYDEVVKKGKKLLKNKDATALIYHLYGNALDNIGKSAKARKAYTDGLKRFPDAGMLCLELGIMDLKENELYKALSRFEQGILATPAFASNYYRAAQLYFETNQKVWGLVYGETEALLAPDNVHRRSEMAAGIRNTWLSALAFNEAPDSVSVKVNLAQAHVLQLVEGSNDSCIEFEGTFEACAAYSAKRSIAQIYPFTGSIAQLSALRGDVLKAYTELTGSLYGNSMSLLSYQKSIMDAGHWEAYNYYLFSTVCPEEFGEWCKASENSEKLSEFIGWSQSSPFKLDDEHTVSRFTVLRDCRTLTLLEALTIQATLLGYE